MVVKDTVTATDYFDQGFTVSISKLLGMLRRNFGMDLAFIGKFERGFRSSVVLNAGERSKLSDNAYFSHPENDTYCRKIADGELPCIIPDTGQNPITRDMAVTDDLSIGAYMGVPIFLSTGEVYGTLCCLKHSTHHSLNSRDPSLLRFVAEVIADRIESLRQSDGRLNEIEERIDQVIAFDELDMHFQPIWGVEKNRVAGYEALARFQTVNYRSPDVWFSEAEEVGQGERLESVAIRRALGALKHLPEDCFISINASPEMVLSRVLAKLLLGTDGERVIVEVTEHARIMDYQAFRNAAQLFRAMGVRLAIDDAGSGYASFKHVMELDADVIKLDLNLIRGIDSDVKKQALAAALISYARRVGAEVVAEGVETQQEFSMLKELDVDKVQGSLIGKAVPLDEISCNPIV
ncbi:EAL domain-containing protein [Marinobacter sp. CHS3-4]|uniref:sensor domain-containing phosphodiesterase n=1 Tax=Marinobacter sp. CHS3-4 TaxID=3045174 RepID=UPI0024B61DC7|nr:EAL domain-containing protein [Marinobacter sp. CHS3-4]MDI9246193.1 EAL domain-containing protein [Marinobacter sp. CHS3-4]